ncbi:MAG TPA: sigma-54-dependent Fis family transcriptional regulator [Petrimonas sp.]|uniref:sigma-54 interaction domain-containing protein n=1 Tax=Petrimonas sp. TaxID=2023866 RepID=UPI0009686ACD|nr:sigma-54 dependent transcriptional regulator [Petrimonas sp.]OJV38849.1 MAG: sigma-54-dependent Fis family transcriptional regulator [Bacteroidia bacterium 43-41]MEA4948946.1 sigma-54 dependent transcriptional regulator [Petrimonas sp.]MEA4979633.1 sigma-54 dependent transcriptional regulator [Petrimonas sp.]MEA5046881.1 sigma-54 dependent transcriptional regulator [Petrimonas sp.]
MAKQNIQQVKQRFGIIGVSPDLDRAIDVALQVAPTDLSVLITGESGVGKENFPQIIHQYSRRKHGPYFAINCGSIPEGTIDSELFGHEKGSFTGATATRKGYFEVANGGTLFLDEVGELPLSTQARLLRVLETGEFIKVGSSQVEKSDVRVVAATNLNIGQAIEKGKFREDLFYRLNSVPIRISPLRDRKEDITLLFRKFAGDCAEKYMMPPIALTDDAREMLRNFRWPGNVRQLKNVTEQISIIEHERVITSEILQKYLPKEEVALPVLASHSRESDQKIFSSEREILYQVLFDMKKDINDLKNVVKNILEDAAAASVSKDEKSMQDKTTVTLPLKYEGLMPKEAQFQEATEVEIASLSLEDAEKEMIVLALEKHNGKRKLAAGELGISERTLYRKIKEYNLEKL